jgi:hypothetical protein
VFVGMVSGCGHSCVTILNSAGPRQVRWLERLLEKGGGGSAGRVCLTTALVPSAALHWWGPFMCMLIPASCGAPPWAKPLLVVADMSTRNLHPPPWHY